MIETQAKIGKGEGALPPNKPILKKKKKGFWTIRTAFVLFALAPALIHLLIFWLGVQIESLKMAFTDYYTDEFTFDNFSLIIGNLFDTKKGNYIGVSFKNTLVFFTMGMCMVPFSLFTVYLIYKKMFGSKLIRILLYLPGAISGIMMVMLFKNLVSVEGPIVKLLQTLNVEGFRDGNAIDFVASDGYALKIIIIYDIWMSIGGNLVIWLGAMGRIPPDVIEYGKLDGVGPVREFISIILPLIWPTVCTILTLNIIGIFGATGSVMAFTEGAHETQTINYWLYSVVYDPTKVNQQNQAAAAGLFFTVLTIPILVLGRWFMNKFGEEVQY
jgi:ABC-type sugar transport system permease subunit